MSDALERGRLLVQQSRYNLAEPELRRALASDPDNPFAHALLSICLARTGQKDAALEEARRAVGLAPDWDFAHYVLSSALDALDRLDEAEQANAEAIRLDPADADYYAQRAGLHFQRSRWEEALRSAEEGLAQDAQNVTCTNLRAMALTKLGRKEEARRTIEGSLARAPENATSHAVHGWAHLEAGRHREALESFRQSLRLDPELEYARSGMVEALKARHLVYRLMLRYFLWMSRQSGKARWAVIIGLYILYRFLWAAGETSPGLRPIVLPLVILYVGFCVLTWFAHPLFDLLLRLNRFGRYALSRRQIAASNWFGGFALAALACGTAWLCTWWDLPLYSAVWCVAMLLPVSSAAGAAKPRRRKVLWTTTILLGAVGLAGIAGLTIDWVHSSLAMGCVGLFLLGWIAFPWLANINWDR